MPHRAALLQNWWLLCIMAEKECCRPGISLGDASAGKYKLYRRANMVVLQEWLGRCGSRRSRDSSHLRASSATRSFSPHWVFVKAFAWLGHEMSSLIIQVQHRICGFSGKAGFMRMVLDFHRIMEPQDRHGWLHALVCGSFRRASLRPADSKPILDRIYKNGGSSPHLWLASIFHQCKQTNLHVFWEKY